MKKLIAVMLVAGMTAFTACSSQKAEETTEDAAAVIDEAADATMNAAETVADTVSSAVEDATAE